MVQFDEVHVTHRVALLERFAGPAVVQLDLATERHLGKKLAGGARIAFALLEGANLVLDMGVGFVDGGQHFGFRCTVENRGAALEAKHSRRPPHVQLKHLANVHSRRHT